MSRCWILLHLLFLSAEDMKDRMLSFGLILELGITGAIYTVHCASKPVLAPGVCLLIMGKISKEKIGLGDGWLILALGMWLSYTELMGMILIGLGMGSIYGILKKAKEIPLVPFLTAGYLLMAGGLLK